MDIFYKGKFVMLLFTYLSYFTYSVYNVITFHL